MANNEISSKTPKDLDAYKGQFVVFFSEDPNPKVLFNSVVPEEAYQKAKEIEATEKRTPVVIRVSETQIGCLAQIFAIHC